MGKSQTEMKNIYTLSSGNIDRPRLFLSLFFLVVLLTGLFSERYFDLHPSNSHVKQYYENQTGSYSLFITLYDSATGRPYETADDTCFSVPPQKINVNVVMW